MTDLNVVNSEVKLTESTEFKKLLQIASSFEGLQLALKHVTDKVSLVKLVDEMRAVQKQIDDQLYLVFNSFEENEAVIAIQNFKRGKKA